MQQSLISEEQIAKLNTVSYLVGNVELFEEALSVASLEPFNEEVLDFLNTLSKNLMMRKDAKLYPDIVTFGFWIRKTSMLRLKERFFEEDGDIHVGRGIAFHIAPSNVPVNYAYSMVAGLITGNINIVRIPTKDFPQVSIINSAINETLQMFQNMKKYIFLVRYERNQKINDIYSSVADTRIVWGGDNTIAELRKSPLGARAGEITFADRYSLAVIDSDMYLEIENKTRFAEEFYNDTYLTDQNACTSPRIVIWTGDEIKKAKETFWRELHELVTAKYTLQDIMGVNKLTSSYIFAATHNEVKIEPHEDNYIVRVSISNPDDSIMEFKDNSGYFFEYDCKDIMEIAPLCNNTHCQTIGYYGDMKDVMPLLKSGVRGIDRVVPIGKTMDFDLIWDGYNLYERLTRTIKISN